MLKRSRPWFLILFILILILIGAFLLKFVQIERMIQNQQTLIENQQNRLNQHQQTLNQFIPTPQNYEYLPFITQPRHQTTVFQSRVAVNGQLLASAVISLLVNGEWVASRVISGGTFSFPGVKLQKGQNKLQVIALFNKEKIVYSPEIWVNYSSEGLPSLSPKMDSSFLVPLIVPDTTDTLLNDLLKNSNDFSRGNKNKKMLSLTFDGDELANITEEILDTLKQYNIKTTMFLTGNYIRKYPDLVTRIHNEGHEIGNHTQQHPHLTLYSSSGRQETLPKVDFSFLYHQLQPVVKLYKNLIGENLKNFWRAPYGDHNPEIRKWASRLGFVHIGWTQGNSWSTGLDTNDWIADSTFPGYHSAQEIKNKILNFGKNQETGINGGIILMHLGSQRQIPDRPHLILGEIIRNLEGKGHQFVTISRLLRESP